MTTMTPQPSEHISGRHVRTNMHNLAQIYAVHLLEVNMRSSDISHVAARSITWPGG